MTRDLFGLKLFVQVQKQAFVPPTFATSKS
jgi:hypothetical protein